MTSTTLPRESVELVGPITATVDGAAVTAFEVALVPRHSRPADTDWKVPTTVNGAQYLLIGPGVLPLKPGSYLLWLRYTAAPEKPVLDDVGTVVIT